MIRRRRTRSRTMMVILTFYSNMLNPFADNVNCGSAGSD